MSEDCHSSGPEKINPTTQFFLDQSYVIEGRWRAATDPEDKARYRMDLENVKKRLEYQKRRLDDDLGSGTAA